MSVIPDYDRRRLALSRLAGAMERITLYAYGLAGSELEDFAARADLVANALWAPIPTSARGYEVGARVEVYSIDDRRWHPGTVVLSGGCEFFGRVSVAVAVDDAVGSPFAWVRTLSGDETRDEIRRAA